MNLPKDLLEIEKKILAKQQKSKTSFERQGGFTHETPTKMPIIGRGAFFQNYKFSQAKAAAAAEDHYLKELLNSQSRVSQHEKSDFSSIPRENSFETPQRKP